MWGALSNEAPPPHPGNTPTFCPLMDACGNSLGDIISFTFISFGAVPFPLSGSAGPDRSHLTLFCKSAIPSLWRTFGIKVIIHCSCMLLVLFGPVWSSKHQQHAPRHQATPSFKTKFSTHSGCHNPGCSRFLRRPALRRKCSSEPLPGIYCVYVENLLLTSQCQLNFDLSISSERCPPSTMKMGTLQVWGKT